MTMATYGGQDIRDRMRNMRDLNIAGPTEESQWGFLNWGELGGNTPFMRGDMMNGYTTDPEALAQWLDANGYKIGVDEGPNRTMRWLEDANGNYVIQPQNYFTNDRTAAILGMLGLGGALYSAVGAGVGAGAGGGSAAGGGAAGSGAWLGEGVASGVPAWDAAAGMTAGEAATGAGGIKTFGSMADVPTFEAMAPMETVGTAAPIDFSAVNAAAGAVPALANVAGGSSVPSWAQGLSPEVLDALKAAGIIGGAIAGSKEQPGATTTSTSRTDPRIDPYLYGDQGVLKAASDWYQANKSGSNDIMRAARERQLAFLNDPALQSGLQGLMGTSLAGANAPIAGNPFTSGLLNLSRWGK